MNDAQRIEILLREVTDADIAKLPAVIALQKRLEAARANAEPARAATQQVVAIIERQKKVVHDANWEIQELARQRGGVIAQALLTGKDPVEADRGMREREDACYLLIEQAKLSTRPLEWELETRRDRMRGPEADVAQAVRDLKTAQDKARRELATARLANQRKGPSAASVPAPRSTVSVPPVRAPKPKPKPTPAPAPAVVIAAQSEVSVPVLDEAESTPTEEVEQVTTIAADASITNADATMADAPLTVA